MKALVFHAPKVVAVEDRQDPALEHPRDVILRVTSTAICGSDLHIYNGAVPQLSPLILGHEFMGMVEDMGFGDYGPRKLPDGLGDEAALFLSDIIPRARPLGERDRVPLIGCDGGPLEAAALGARRDSVSVVIEDASEHIVVVTFRGASSDEEIEDYLSRMTSEILGRPQRTVTILDALAASRPSVVQGRLQLRWLDVHHDELRRFSLGTAFVVPSVLARGALMAIFWLKPMSQPHVVCATLDEALHWADERVHIAFPMG